MDGSFFCMDKENHREREVFAEGDHPDAASWDLPHRGSHDGRPFQMA